MKKHTMGACALLISLVSTTQASLIVNGSFEDPVVGGSFSQLSSGNTTLTGWTISDGGQTAGDGGVTVVRGFDGTVASVGDQWLSLQISNSADSGTISQDFTTTVGLDYLLEFDYSAVDFGTHNLTITYGVGGPDQTVDFTSQDAQVPWATETFGFTASATTTTLSFSGDFFSGFWGAGIDNVSVIAVPEPSSSLLSLVVIAAFALRRRN